MEKPDLALVSAGLPDIGDRDLARILESSDHGESVRTVLTSGPGTPCDDRHDESPEHHVFRWSHVDEVVTFVNTMLDTGESRDPALLAQPLTVGPLQMDPERATVLVDGKAIALTHREFRFLHVLALNAERTCTREEIRKLVWDGDAEVIGRTVDVLVSRLRSKLLAATGRELVETVRGIGYRLGASPGTRPEDETGLTRPTDTQ
jgi:DNA-binding winged helix-turn-helix (wHTH) protein